MINEDYRKFTLDELVAFCMEERSGRSHAEGIAWFEKMNEVVIKLLELKDIKEAIPGVYELIQKYKARTSSKG